MYIFYLKLSAYNAPGHTTLRNKYDNGGLTNVYLFI